MQEIFDDGKSIFMTTAGDGTAAGCFQIVPAAQLVVPRH